MEERGRWSDGDRNCDEGSGNDACVWEVRLEGWWWNYWK